MSCSPEWNGCKDDLLDDIIHDGTDAHAEHAAKKPTSGLKKE